jgi:hypothetical protein
MKSRQTTKAKRTPGAIHGIPCRVRSRELRRAIRQVIDQVRERCPRDFARLRRLVREIRPLSGRERREGTLGRWVEDPETGDPWEWGPDELQGAFPGVLLLSEELDPACLVATVAHELGHACTTDADMDRRGPVFTDAWASEFSADWYAYKWGFGKHIARQREHRHFGHHGAGPGQRFAVGSDGRERWFRVTRNFVVQEIEPQPVEPPAEGKGKKKPRGK